MNQKKKGLQSLVNKISKLKKRTLAKEGLVHLDEYKNSTFNLETKNVLVVDEDEETREKIKKVFEKSYISILTAESVMDFAKIIEKSDVDLMIIDIRLSWVDGFELCELLRAHGAFKTVPIILSIDHSYQEDIKKGFDLGANAYMIKPFEEKELQKKVEDLLALS